MKLIKLPEFIRVLLCLCLLTGWAGADAAPDQGVKTVRLQSTCDAGDNNCFEDLPGLLSWAFSVRNPSESDPLNVDIGSGEFIAPATLFQGFCNAVPALSKGWVTFRGAGQDRTVLTGGSGFAGAIFVTDCTEMTFQDLTVRSDTRRGIPAGSNNAVYWIGDGNSKWINVTFEASLHAWVDTLCSGTGVHYVFSSLVDSRTIGWQSECADNWLYGTEILIHNPSHPCSPESNAS